MSYFVISHLARVVAFKLSAITILPMKRRIKRRHYQQLVSVLTWIRMNLINIEPIFLLDAVVVSKPEEEISNFLS